MSPFLKIFQWFPTALRIKSPTAQHSWESLQGLSPALSHATIYSIWPQCCVTSPIHQVLPPLENFIYAAHLDTPFPSLPSSMGGPTQYCFPLPPSPQGDLLPSFFPLQFPFSTQNIPITAHSSSDNQLHSLTHSPLKRAPPPNSLVPGTQ